MPGRRRSLLLTVWALPVAYAAAFLATRAYALAFQPEMAPDPEGWALTHAVVAVNGFRVHHLYYGFALLAAAGAFLLARRRAWWTWALAGTGLALIVDEIMLVATGFTVYNHPWRLPIAVVTGALLVGACFLLERERQRAGPRRAS